MKAKSAVLASTRQPQARKPVGQKRRVTVRMPAAERRAQILAKAFEFFSEYGLTAQTRLLAEACGVSQRLLYSLFPNKSALIKAVYEEAIAGPFKAIWIVQLRDRSVPLEQRLNAFYRDYYDTILTRRWLRLFLYASLAEVDMAPTYIAEIIPEPCSRPSWRKQPTIPGGCCRKTCALVREFGWMLHGNISHLAIRRQIYRDATSVCVNRVIALHVTGFLAAIVQLLEKG